MSKGSKPRPMRISRKEYEDNWEKAFKKENENVNQDSTDVYVSNTALSLEVVEDYLKLIGEGESQDGKR